MDKPAVMVEVLVGRGWYRDAVGEQFECVRWGSEWVLKEDYDLGRQAMWRHIQREDAQEVINVNDQEVIDGGY
jgi:hypothetical protein